MKTRLRSLFAALFVAGLRKGPPRPSHYHHSFPCMKPLISIKTALLSAALLASCSPATMEKAAATGSLAQLNQLLAAGNSIEERSSNGKTPLLQACRFSQAEAAIFLINKGADVNAIDSQQWSAMHLTARYMNEPGALQAAQLLHSKGSNLETRTDKGVTPLMLAACTNDTRLTKWLIDRGVQLNTVDYDGRNALDYAYISKANKTADILAAKGLTSKKTVSPWAPDSLAGKMIVYSTSDLYPAVYKYTNKRKPWSYENGDFMATNDGYQWNYTYRKTGPQTAVVEHFDYQEGVIYYLRFDNATTGTATTDPSYTGRSFRFSVK